MDRNTVIGLVLIGAILFGFSWFNSRQQRQMMEEQARLDSIARANYVEQPLAPAQNPQLQAAETEADSLAGNSFEQQLEASLGATLYAARNGEEEFFTLENDKLTVTLSTKGGAMHSAVLKDYQSYNQTPLNLFEEGSNRFNLSLFTTQTIDTEQFYFTPVERQNIVVGEDDAQGQSFALRLYADSASYLEYVYTINPGEYMIDFDVRMVGMEDKLARNQSYFDIQWETISEQNEKGFENENNYTSVAYRFPGDTGIEEMTRSTASKSQTENAEIQWVAFKQQFFSAILVARDRFTNGTMGFDTFDENSGKIKHNRAHLSVAYSPDKSDYGFQFYLGPNNYRVLKSYDMQLQKLIPLGGKWISWISTVIIIPFFDFMMRFITSYGLIILLLTVLIKLILFPFTYKSYLSMAKMRVLQPEIQALNEKFPKQDDALKKQQATMALYKSAGVSPFGGCLPLLLQMPILFAMFRFFPSSIELRQKSFLWADDLSAYDNVLDFGFNIPLYGDHLSLFALLTAATMILSQKLTQPPQQNNQAMPGMKMMMYLMPVMFLFWFNNSASGLSYYYLISNLITIGQTYIMRSVISEDKLHAQMKANQAKGVKPKKKSKFMERYEEALKQQQRQAGRK
ncbi:MAG: membrane protein insertase YidC [Rikenellaceae bacterium]|jgi:YidC/Oxa1 family membrane protein insertase|nr:membrane protein insertase YidC [Rikenellaceae bacterium]